jgi:glycosyl transferase family 2
LGVIPCPAPHLPGVVGVITGELSRYPDFTKCLERLMVPIGTTWEWVEGSGFAKNRNEIVRRFLAKQDAAWLWFIDDDNTFAPDTLMRLLDRNVDIVQPLICNRKPPYNVHAYSQMESDYVPIPFNQIPNGVLMSCHAVSSGGVLIRRRVFEDIPDPWYEEGKTKADEPGEDLTFCKKALEQHFEIWLDTAVEMGHMSKTTVFLRWYNGQWVHEFEMDKAFTARLPVNR